MPGTWNQMNLLLRACQGLMSTHFSAGAVLNITDAYNAAGRAITGGGPGTANGAAEALPNRDIMLQSLRGDLTTIAGGMTSVTWFLAWDSAGAQAITPEITTSIVLQVGSAVIGTVPASIRDGGFPLQRITGDGDASTVYLFAKSAQAGGSGALTPFLFWTGTTDSTILQ